MTLAELLDGISEGRYLPELFKEALASEHIGDEHKGIVRKVRYKWSYLAPVDVDWVSARLGALKLPRLAIYMRFFEAKGFSVDEVHATARAALLNVDFNEAYLLQLTLPKEFIAAWGIQELTPYQFNFGCLWAREKSIDYIKRRVQSALDANDADGFLEWRNVLDSYDTP